MTFWNQEEEISSGEDPLRELLGQATGRGELKESDLGPPPTLGPELESFLEVPTPTQGAGDRCGSPAEPSIKNYEVWLEWWGQQFDMPECWGELVTIPNAGDPKRLAHKVHASFQVSQVRCKALRDPEDYTTPPALKCIQRKMFLLAPDPHLPCQGYHLKQPQRTLDYAQALQYWAKKANPPCPDEPCHLAMCVHELRWATKLYMTFSDCNILEGLTCKTSEAGVEETMQPNPTESTLVDDPATLMTAPSTLADESATLVTTPSIPAEELIAFVTIPAVLADEPADSTTLLEPTSDMGKAEDPEYPKWIKVHSSHLVASLGSVSSTLGDLM